MLRPLASDRIRTLRAIGAPPDPLALRLEVERALGSADLHPPGMPRGAIVCVRRVRVGPPRRAAGAWIAQVDRLLQGLLARRARPFRETVPAGAEVVVFLDEAELMACLARDWKRGAGGAWWWRSLFGEGPSEALVRRVWIEAPIFAPAALELLAEEGLATDVLRSLPPGFCARLGAAIATAFGMPDWTEPTAERPALSANGPPARAAAAGGVRSFALRARVRDLVRACPGLESLPRPQRAVLGMAVALRRAPSLARRPGFVAALHDDGWLDVPISLPKRTSRERHEAFAASAGRVVPTGARVAEEAPGVAKVNGCEEPPSGPAGTASAAAAPPPVGLGLPPASTPEILSAGSGAAGPQSPLPAPLVRGGETLAPAWEPTFVDSAHAGVLYLINLAIRLDFYGDFTQPARPGLALPLGDFLALIGERTCGPPLRGDALWELLARLAGRAADDPPGADFVPPGGGDLASWLDCVAAALEHDAARALDVGEGAALALLCRCRGRVALGPARLEAVFPLADHPFAIRLAALDRDPGWVPAAGRVIQFHYD
jgi:hypothetical protein